MVSCLLTVPTYTEKTIKAMLLCIEYGILFVDTVDMKIKARNALNAMLCRNCQYWCLWLLHNTLYRGVKTLLYSV